MLLLLSIKKIVLVLTQIIIYWKTLSEVLSQWSAQWFLTHRCNSLNFSISCTFFGNTCRKPSEGGEGERQNTLSRSFSLYSRGCAIDPPASSASSGLRENTRGAGTQTNWRAKWKLRGNLGSHWHNGVLYKTLWSLCSCVLVREERQN